jgi:peptide/nickel transport system substrate-binding protein
MLSRALKASAQEPIGQIRWALPHAWSTHIGAIMSLVQEAPLAFADDFSLIPAAAEAWKRSNVSQSLDRAQI